MNTQSIGARNMWSGVAEPLVTSGAFDSLVQNGYTREQVVVEWQCDTRLIGGNNSTRLTCIHLHTEHRFALEVTHTRTREQTAADVAQAAAQMIAHIKEFIVRRYKPERDARMRRHVLAFVAACGRDRRYWLPEEMWILITGEYIIDR